MTIVKPDGSQFNVDGKLYDKVNLVMVIDGYNAPLTGGNFVDLVNKGFYNKKVITRSDGFVVQVSSMLVNFFEVLNFVFSFAQSDR